VRRLFSTAAVCAFSGVLFTGCAPVPKRPLVAGYYGLDGTYAGYVRRLIVTSGERRLSYDVWRISPTGDGTSRHAHYDLIASDQVPDSGAFAVTQDGTDCGTMWIQPYRDGDGVHDEILILTYDGVSEPLGSGAIKDRPTPEQYPEQDREYMQQIAVLAAERPNLYAMMNRRQKSDYSALLPDCQGV
jgi:hypothetical protein